jgi:hypothetical protein
MKKSRQLSSVGARLAVCTAALLLGLISVTANAAIITVSTIIDSFRGSGAIDVSSTGEVFLYTEQLINPDASLIASDALLKADGAGGYPLTVSMSGW